MTDPFTLLGLPARRDLTDEDVRAAWRRIAAVTHPDLADGGDPDRYSAAAAAYDTLRTAFGRGEALADLGLAGPPGRARSPRHHGRRTVAAAGTATAAAVTATAAAGTVTAVAGTVTAAARNVIAAARTATAAARHVLAAAGTVMTAAVAVAVAGWTPASIALVAGAATWLVTGWGRRRRGGRGR